MRFSKVLIFLIIGGLGLFSVSCEEVNPNFQEEAKDSEHIHQSMKKLTDVIVHDIFSPPVASRIYAYPSIAAYEVLIHDHPDYQSLQGQLTDFKDVPQPETDQEYCYPLASVQAFLKVGKALIFSEPKIEAFQEEMYEKFKAVKMPNAVFERSIKYGNAVAAHIFSLGG